MALSKEKLQEDMAIFMYKHLLNNKHLAVPHDNAVQNQIWQDAYLQQKIIQPLRHHLGEQEIISKFNQIFNAAAQDIRKQYGENLYDLQSYDDDMFYTNSGITEEPYHDQPYSYQGQETTTGSNVIPALTYDSYQGDLTAKEKKYLTEMRLVFNDEKSAIAKTYNKFAKFGASAELIKMYNEAFAYDEDWDYELTPAKARQLKRFVQQHADEYNDYYTPEDIRNISQEILRDFGINVNDEKALGILRDLFPSEDESEEMLFSAPPAYPR